MNLYHELPALDVLRHSDDDRVQLNECNLGVAALSTIAEMPKLRLLVLSKCRVELLTRGIVQRQQLETLTPHAA